MNMSTRPKKPTLRKSASPIIRQLWPMNTRGRGVIGRRNLNNAPKKSRSCASWDCPIAMLHVTLSPRDVTDDEDTASQRSSLKWKPNRFPTSLRIVCDDATFDHICKPRALPKKASRRCASSRWWLTPAARCVLVAGLILWLWTWRACE